MHIDFPENLPVSSRVLDIQAAIESHPVVIVCGETGSGKTTQLPKILLAMGRGQPSGPGQSPRLIGHTQPRRMAATSVAKRIAEELQTPLGSIVGYKIRFQDRLLPGARIKLMTDGILLAEAQSDPLLRAYDALIIDEAHERSLNIDFLLGHLRHILPQRPDLKIIITSATIDAQRFSQHFASLYGPAPIFTVSGRTYPVEQRWRPFEESREYGFNEAITDAVQELWRAGASSGDILVFLPGEREIRDVADHLRRTLATQPALRNTEVLPLFARLSQTDQEKVFQSGHARRIVLATNVAETSLTVPGIRFVIDSGLARVKRYSYRNKVEQLQIEPISQAAANQRAGRCGRVADGICIRLFSETDYQGSPAFTDPEILRSSLASVILRMKSLGLGHIDDFPFIEPPARKAIADGYSLLQELGAIDEQYNLTGLGHELARLPLDPRIGRMILAARHYQCLHEVLIIASALSTQDVRDRPHDRQAAADEKHRIFLDEKSEFVGFIKLWDWIESVRGKSQSEHEPQSHKLSQRQQENRLREHFIHPRRVREWRDIHTQLHTVVCEHNWHINSAPATYEQIHKAMLCGLLGNIGYKLDNEDVYLGARGIKFVPHPGAHLSRKPGRWLVAAELVETTRLFGRGLATMDPQWLPELAAHVIKKQLLEPHWERKVNEVVALERATLYGLVVYNNKRVNFGRIDLPVAREIFIREALVNNDIPSDWANRFAFIGHNQKMIRSIEQLEHQSRRQDVLVDDELIYAFYAQHLGAEVCGGPSLERWYRHAVRNTPGILKLQREELMRHEAAGLTTQAFPKLIRLGGIDCSVSYLHQPGDPQDGITVTIPIYALNQVHEMRCEWLVPGMLHDKVLALLKSLPAKVRSRLVPLPSFASEFCTQVSFAQEPLINALIAAIRAKTQFSVVINDFKLDQLAPHLFMNMRIVDEHGRQLGIGRYLPKLKADLSSQARSAFSVLATMTVKTSLQESSTTNTPTVHSNSRSKPTNKATPPPNNPKVCVRAVFKHPCGGSGSHLAKSQASSPVPSKNGRTKRNAASAP